MIFDKFDSEETADICAIPMSKIELSDVLIWHYDNSGSYTMKNGYKMLLQTEEGNVEDNVRENNKHWSKVWFIKIPRKIQNFM